MSKNGYFIQVRITMLSINICSINWKKRKWGNRRCKFFLLEYSKGSHFILGHEKLNKWVFKFPFEFSSLKLFDWMFDSFQFKWDCSVLDQWEKYAKLKFDFFSPNNDNVEKVMNEFLWERIFCVKSFTKELM